MDGYLSAKRQLRLAGGAGKRIRMEGLSHAQWQWRTMPERRMLRKLIARAMRNAEEEALAHAMAHDAWLERCASSLRAQCATQKEKKHGGAVAHDGTRCLVEARCAREKHGSAVAPDGLRCLERRTIRWGGARTMMTHDHDGEAR